MVPLHRVCHGGAIRRVAVRLPCTGVGVGLRVGACMARANIFETEVPITAEVTCAVTYTPRWARVRWCRGGLGLGGAEVG